MQLPKGALAKVECEGLEGQIVSLEPIADPEALRRYCALCGSLSDAPLTYAVGHGRRGYCGPCTLAAPVKVQ